LSNPISDESRSHLHVQETTAYPGSASMHPVELSASRLEAEDRTKDIDCLREGIAGQRRSG
jgi:hypothetical protein